MTPEEKALLERTAKLSEENNKILRSIQRKTRWAFAWGVAKFAILVVPLIIGYFYLEPYFAPIKAEFEQIQQSFGHAQDIINSIP